MALFINSNMYCCGMNEISLLSGERDAETAMREFARATLFHISRNWTAPRNTWVNGIPPVELLPRRSMGAAHFIFTQATKTAKYGTNFAKLIEDYKLGTVTSTDWQVNPNSRRQVKCWVWTPDRQALIRWYKKHAEAST